VTGTADAAPKLIMVTGSSPGTGKSTVAQLTAQGVPLWCIHGDDAAHLDAFAPVRENFWEGFPEIDFARRDNRS